MKAGNITAIKRWHDISILPVKGAVRGGSIKSHIRLEKGAGSLNIAKIPIINTSVTALASRI